MKLAITKVTESIKIYVVISTFSLDEHIALPGVAVYDVKSTNVSRTTSI